PCIAPARNLATFPPHAPTLAVGAAQRAISPSTVQPMMASCCPDLAQLTAPTVKKLAAAHFRFPTLGPKKREDPIASIPAENSSRSEMGRYALSPPAFPSASSRGS